MEKTNWELFLETVDTFKYSQGFYSRIANQINSMDEEELENAKEQMNSMEERFNNTLDVVMWLES